jgi:PAS domain S-box-containing protein
MPAAKEAGDKVTSSPGSLAVSEETAKGIQAIRAALLMLVLLATAAGAASFDRLRGLPLHLETIPLLLFAVICVLVVLVYAKVREMAGLRGAVATLQNQQSALASEMEVQKLLQTVAASRESFRDVIDSFDSAVFTLSLDGKVRAANKAFVRILDRAFPQVIGSVIWDLIVEPSAEELQAALPTFLEKRHWSGPVRVLIATTGQWKYFECTLHPVLQDESVLAITIIANDVTAERERETVFSALFDTLREPVWVSTCEGRLLDLNDGFVSMVGAVSKQHLLNQNMLEMVLEPERQNMADALRRRDPIKDLEVTLACANGARAFCIANATPVTEISGAARYQGTFTDITQRRTVERRLACEQKFREQLIASFPDAIMTLDASGRISFASGRAERMFNKPSDALLASSIFDQIVPHDEMALLTFLEDCIALPDTVCSREFNLRSSEGGIRRRVQITGTGLQDHECKVLGVVASLRDVTERPQIEQQLVANDRMAAIGQMTRGFSHELNGCLAGMVGACALLKDVELPVEARKTLDLLEGETARACEIVGDLLFYAQPSSGGMAAVSVRDVIDSTLALRRYALRAKNISTDLQVADAVPKIIGERAQLIQLFLNLLVNAEDECVAGGRNARTIYIRIGVVEGFVSCTVEANRVSFKPDHTAQMEPSGNRQTTDAVGLGLNICRSIVQTHAGRIEVSTPAGGGASFRVCLPALAETDTAAYSVDAP